MEQPNETFDKTFSHLSPDTFTEELELVQSAEQSANLAGQSAEMRLSGFSSSGFDSSDPTAYTGTNPFMRPISPREPMTNNGTFYCDPRSSYDI